MLFAINKNSFVTGTNFYLNDKMPSCAKFVENLHRSLKPFIIGWIRSDIQKWWTSFGTSFRDDYVRNNRQNQLDGIGCSTSLITRINVQWFSSFDFFNNFERKKIGKMAAAFSHWGKWMLSCWWFSGWFGAFLSQLLTVCNVDAYLMPKHGTTTN